MISVEGVMGSGKDKGNGGNLSGKTYHETGKLGDRCAGI